MTSSPLPVEPVHPQVVSESEQNPSQGGSSVPVPVQPPPTVAINKNSTGPRITPPAVEPGASVKLSHRLTIFLQCYIVFLNNSGYKEGKYKLRIDACLNHKLGYRDSGRILRTSATMSFIIACRADDKSIHHKCQVKLLKTVAYE